jgi:hypothetical protein
MVRICAFVRFVVFYLLFSGSGGLDVKKVLNRHKCDTQVLWLFFIPSAFSRYKHGRKALYQFVSQLKEYQF